jgi:putative ABC transport system substrate-binding protein
MFGRERRSGFASSKFLTLPTDGRRHERNKPSVAGLMSDGPNYFDMFHRAGSYAGRILKGAKPADLPVEEPDRFYLVINLKTAKVLGLDVPPSLQ